METKPFYPHPVSDQGEPANNCAPDRTAWENDMLRAVLGAGLHDAANCFEDALRTKRKLELQERARQAKHQTNGDRIRAMTDEELAKLLSTGAFICGRLKDVCEDMPGCEECLLAWLRSPVEESET